MDMLNNMTIDRWRKMTANQQEKIKDNSLLQRSLIGYEGRQVEAVLADGSTRRFWVGITGGWRPQHAMLEHRKDTEGELLVEAPLSVTVLARLQRPICKIQNAPWVFKPHKS